MTLRVISSTLLEEADPEREDAFREAVEAGELLRETYSLDQIGQKDYRIALFAYTDPDGHGRFAVLDDSPAESDWQDTGSFPEALAFYEKLVRDAAKCAMPQYTREGDELPTFTYSDVPGVSAEEEGDGHSGTRTGWLIAAEFADIEAAEAQRYAAERTRAKQLVFARAVDAYGYGGVAALARRRGISEPAVKTVADKGRALLAELAAADRPQLTADHIRQLLRAQCEDPVLYVKVGPDSGGGAPELDVWASAYVHRDAVVTTRADVIDDLGEDPEPDLIEAALPGWQANADRITDELTR